ncbi:hypothetical protein VTN31DRAFT_2703 [Thermomyces dupontii]|uniref:uncharacterized protein n=1 Tax=Talaromyces thermophilus TaxID=28565 RepID=UPI00374352C3
MRGGGACSHKHAEGVLPGVFPYHKFPKTRVQLGEYSGRTLLVSLDFLFVCQLHESGVERVGIVLQAYGELMKRLPAPCQSDWGLDRLPRVSRRAALLVVSAHMGFSLPRMVCGFAPDASCNIGNSKFIGTVSIRVLLELPLRGENPIFKLGICLFAVFLASKNRGDRRPQTFVASGQSSPVSAVMAFGVALSSRPDCISLTRRPRTSHSAL